jgi:hypothetical protein
MNNTTFKLGDMSWVQLSGTAMGFPAAPVYATLYFTIHEITTIPSCKSLVLYGRHIDDAFGIWTPDTEAGTNPGSSISTYSELSNTYNKVGNLR